VRLIDHENNQIGVVSTQEAMRMAQDAGLDLVEVAPRERPPVCRIMDYGKFKYAQKKKKNKQHHEQKLKEVRLHPKTSEHDREIKIKQAAGFLKKGDKVQFTIIFRGRERFHKEVGDQILKEIAEFLGDEVKVERTPRFEGWRMTMVVSPQKKK
jgi:translation initiation factor IF-3